MNARPLFQEVFINNFNKDYRSRHVYVLGCRVIGSIQNHFGFLRPQIGIPRGIADLRLDTPISVRAFRKSDSAFFLRDLAAFDVSVRSS